MLFIKPPTSYQQQIDLLIARGISIENHDRARCFLSHLNYYRLSAYWLPFEREHANHQFKPGTTFDSVVEHYDFDRELRLLIMDAIERFEVSLKGQGVRAQQLTNYKSPVSFQGYSEWAMRRYRGRARGCLSGRKKDRKVSAALEQVGNLLIVEL